MEHQNLMLEIDIYLPKTYNDGRQIEAEKIAALKARLRKRFGGVTHFEYGNEGEWSMGKVVFKEKISLLRVLAEPDPKHERYLASLRVSIKKSLRQEDILMISRTIRVFS